MAWRKDNTSGMHVDDKAKAVWVPGMGAVDTSGNLYVYADRAKYKLNDLDNSRRIKALEYAAKATEIFGGPKKLANSMPEMRKSEIVERPVEVTKPAPFSSISGLKNSLGI